MYFEWDIAHWLPHPLARSSYRVIPLLLQTHTYGAVNHCIHHYPCDNTPCLRIGLDLVVSTNGSMNEMLSISIFIDLSCRCFGKNIMRRSNHEIIHIHTYIYIHFAYTLYTRYVFGTVHVTYYIYI